jgi:CTP synthase
VRTIYEVPLVLEEQQAADRILQRFNLPAKKGNLTKWTSMVDRIVNPKQTTNITFVGKYVHLKDSYMSHIEAFNHAGSMCSAKVNINWVEAEDLENPKEDPKKGLTLLKGTQGILVPGGFGARGSEGKIIAANYAMDKKIPYLGICFGFQLAVIAYCRKVMKLEDANSSELNPSTPHPVIDLLPEQGSVVDMGGTMRLGAHEIILEKDCITARLYKKNIISERHRHRYEVNPKYIEKINKAGLRFVGRSKDGTRMEVMELKGHPFFLGCQFHPEFKSRPGKPSPLHFGLLRAALKNVCK